MARILRVSESAALAMHSMVLMAANPGRPLTTGEMARDLDASEATLAKALQRLGVAGLVGSRRGPKGGHALARPAKKVTLLEVYEAVDGPLETSSCLFDLPVCGGLCILGGLLEEIGSKVRERLKGARLSELAAVYGKEGKAHAKA